MVADVDRPTDAGCEPETIDLPADAPQMPGYRVRGTLGQGGMGRVYLAQDEALGRQVAIKVVREDLGDDEGLHERFLCEARAMASVEHPNTVRVYAFGQAEGRSYLVMEYVQGSSLDGRLRERRSLPVAEALDILRQSVSALEAAWSRGVVHRDVKPSNILLDTRNRVRLTDFGLARIVSRGAGAEAPSGVIVGTPHYMSPEQARGEATVDFRSDLYSLGVVLYEMVTGVRPFDGSTPFAIVDRILNETPPPLAERRADIPPGVVALCERLMRKGQSARPASHREVLEEIGALLAGVASAAEIARRARALAVLPFTDMSPGKDQDYFCEGIADELISALARLPEFRVASRTSAFSISGRGLDIREIGSRLNVDAVIEGSVRKAGDRIRISTQLVDVTSGHSLWSERYDREMSDVFAVQDEITARIVESLQLELTPRAEVDSAWGTDSVEAYELYLRGKKQLSTLTRRGIEHAIELFERATGIDPGYAVAHAGIANACSFACMYLGGGEAALSRAQEASSRALALAPGRAEAHVARGLALSLAKCFDEAEALFECAIDLDPNLYDAHFLYARACVAQGRMERVVQLCERALEIRPESYEAAQLIAMAHERMGRAREREAAARRALALVERHLALEPDDARALYIAAQNALRIEDRERGLEWAGRVIALAADDAPVLYNLACIFALAGETARALDTLEQAVEAGFTHREWVENDSDLDPLHQDPRFAEILARMG